MKAKKTNKSLLGRILISVSISFLLLFVALLSLSGYFKLSQHDKVSAFRADTIKLDNLDLIKINIQNACGASGIAENLKNYLREKGFDVVQTGNFNQKIDQTFIINHTKDTLAPLKIAKVLDISRSSIITKLDSACFLNCTIILGNDYNNLKPFHNY